MHTQKYRIVVQGRWYYGGKKPLEVPKYLAEAVITLLILQGCKVPLELVPVPRGPVQ